MSLARTRLLSAGLLVALGITALPIWAGTVVLKNGSRIDGKVDDNRGAGGQVVVHVDDGGQIVIPGYQVETLFTEDAVPAPQPESTPLPVGKYVRVQLPSGTDQQGTGAYQGVLSADSNDEALVLEIPGAGKIKIRHPAGATIAEVAPPQAPAPSDRAIKTSNLIFLKNGRKLAGTVVATPENEPLKLRIGDIGMLTIPRDTIAPDGVKEVEGEIPLSQPPAAKDESEPVKPIIPDDVREQIKQELRRELLQELLDEMIDRKLDDQFERERARSLGMGEDVEATLSESEIAEIEENIRELTRQRNTNRVRAENNLKSIGKDAIPFLAQVAQHPFELTRRSVQRIVGSVGDLRGAPIAIHGLNDPDPFVRQLAHEAIEQILPSEISYRSTGSEKHRAEAQARYQELWDKTVRDRLRDRVLASVIDER